LIVIAGSAWAGPVPLTGEALRDELVGSLLKIDTPLGVVIPVRVSADGLVSGEAGSLASTLGAAHDRGRWWIDNDRLCVKWFRWFEAQTRCLTVEHEGAKIYWRDQSGESGTATIVKSDPRPDAVVPSRIVDAIQPSTPSGTPAPSSGSVAANPLPPNEADEEVRPLRYAAVDLAASILVGDSYKPEPNKLGVNASNPPTTSPTTATKLEPRPTDQIATRTKTARDPEPSFHVTNVAVDDALTIRSGPSEYHPPVGLISPNGTGVRIVGACHEVWCPIRHQGSAGWVNRYYLADENAMPQRESGRP
jgi:Bacterial SH3 domain